jgi:hypothetical protein
MGDRAAHTLIKYMIGRMRLFAGAQVVESDPIPEEREEGEGGREGRRERGKKGEREGGREGR